MDEVAQRQWSESAKIGIHSGTGCSNTTSGQNTRNFSYHNLMKLDLVYEKQSVWDYTYMHTIHYI
jgi:hypothetical protein